MTLSKRAALGVSLGAIALYWIHQIAVGGTGPGMPAHFSQLVLRIVRDKLIVAAGLFALLHLEGEGFDRLGVTRREWPKHVSLGLAIGLAMFVGLNVVLDTGLNSLIPRSPLGSHSIMAFFKDPRNLLAWLPIGIIGGGVIEELQRIFVLTRFEKWLGRPGLILGVALSSAMFGYGHLYQGLGTAIGAILSGVAFSLVYLRRRSALEPITAHAISDVLAVLAATMLAR